MAQLTFRSSFSVRTRLGNRRKYLNKRTASALKILSPPVIIVDVDYFEHLIKSKQKSKVSLLYNNDAVYPQVHSWLQSILQLTSPAGIIFVAKECNAFCSNFPYPIIYSNLRDLVYTYKVRNILPNHLVIVSNILDLWVVSSNTANLSFIAIDTNNRLLHYSNTTGLDIVSKFIGTYKIINKLGLSHLKYLNLQYLFIMLFYLKITNKSPNDFYFDGTYFRTLPKYSKPFLKSNGLGLDLITQAHKFLSYAFLTKPEFLDFFLLGDADHYSLQLSRLLKILPMDMYILRNLKSQYDTLHKPSLLTNLIVPDFRISLKGNLSQYSNIWAGKNMALSYCEHKAFAKILRRYFAYDSYDITNLLTTLPKGLQADFKKVTPRPESKPADTSDIEDYISNLISGVY